MLNHCPCGFCATKRATIEDLEARLAERDETIRQLRAQLSIEQTQSVNNHQDLTMRLAQARLSTPEEAVCIMGDGQPLVRMRVIETL